jgi:1-phosphatidylinositol-4-phosphate 5-kinase
LKEDELKLLVREGILD